MNKKYDDLDDVVEKITERVAEKLKQMGLAGGNHQIPNDKTHCHVPNQDCDNCGHCVVKKTGAVQNILNSGASRISTNAGLRETVCQDMAGMIDHTILKPDTTREELTRVCEEAKQYKFATVCVNSSNIPLVARLLRGSGVKPIAVVGFPLGASTTASKVFEAKTAIQEGAEEIDMVINIGALKSKDYKLVLDDISRVVEASRPHKVKVILETSNINNDEKISGCVLSKAAGAAFVKTSTGFGKGGATVEDVSLMRRIVGADMEVKASGGIRTKEDAEAMVNAGADRIGASASVAIVTGRKAKAGNY